VEGELEEEIGFRIVRMCLLRFESKSGWWFQRFFGIFTPNFGEDEPNLTLIFFKGVGSTTN